MSPSPAGTDVAALLDRGRWTRYQQLLTLLAALAVIFDGFDIQILGFAIPSIMREWGVARAGFASVLAIGMAGMALGSPFAGYCGDRFGRRVTLIGCVTLFGAATIATGFAHNFGELAVLRFLTGLGTGGALPNAGALASEFAPYRRRPLAMMLTIVCVPLGGMLGGILAARVLPLYGWHTLYFLGGGAPLLYALLLLTALPESPRFLARRPHRWDELTALMLKLGCVVPLGSRFEDPAEAAADARPALQSLLGPGYLRDTLGLWLAYFCNLAGAYLVFSWLPTLLTAEGLGVAAASSGLAAYNMGGVIGVLVCAAVVTVAGSRAPLLIAALAGALSALVLAWIPAQAGGSHSYLIAGLAVHGLFANAVQTTMYALAAHIYPTKVRASGVATAGAMGRAGGLLSSLTGSAIIHSGSSTFYRLLAAAMFVTFIGLSLIRKHFPPASPTRY